MSTFFVFDTAVLRICICLVFLVFRAGLKRGSAVRLPGAPAYKGHSEITGIIRNMVLKNSGYHMQLNFWKK